MAELELEVGSHGWDAILVQETWRGKREENEIRGSGHRWLGSGGAGRKYRVGTLVHSGLRSAVDELRPLSPRLASLDLHIKGRKVTLIVVYVPHAGYTVEEVEALYEEVAQEVATAENKGAAVVIGGDFNAEAREAQEREDLR